MRTHVLLGLLALAACSAGDKSVDSAADTGPPPPTTPTDTASDVVVDTFAFESPQVDVLFVVDNSASMMEEQAALSEAFGAWMGPFLAAPHLDWHIGVISTDMHDPDHVGTLRGARDVRFLDRDTPDLEATFDEMARLGTAGSGDERGREAAFTALELKKDADNAGFLRDDSDLHVVFLSDEDDNSSERPITEDGFVRFLEERGAVAHAAVLPEGATDPFGDAEAGLIYASYARRTGGIRVDLRSELDDLIHGLGAAFPRLLYTPSRAPDVATLDVGIELPDGTLLDIDESTWLWDDDVEAVELIDYAPPEGATVVLSYVPA